MTKTTKIFLVIQKKFWSDKKKTAPDSAILRKSTNAIRAALCERLCFFHVLIARRRFFSCTVAHHRPRVVQRDTAGSEAREGQHHRPPQQHRQGPTPVRPSSRGLRQSVHYLQRRGTTGFAVFPVVSTDGLLFNEYLHLSTYDFVRIVTL